MTLNGQHPDGWHLCEAKDFEFWQKRGELRRVSEYTGIITEYRAFGLFMRQIA
jgi:hypothetical protein